MRKDLYKGKMALIYSQKIIVLGNRIIINEYWETREEHIESKWLLWKQNSVIAEKCGNHSWPSAVFNEALIMSMQFIN